MAPRSQEENERIREERIAQILAATMKIYLEKGVGGTDIGGIAKEAGIARSLVYYYYKDKIDVLKELFLRYISEAKKYINISLTADEEVIYKLTKYTKFYLLMARNQSDLLRFYRNLENDIYLVFGTEAETVLDDYITSTHQPLIDAFQQAIDEGKLKKYDAKLLVNIYWGSLLGALEYLKKNPAVDVTEENVTNIISLIFDGIK